MIGLVFNADIQSDLNPDKIKDVISVLDDEIVVTESQFWLWQWIAQYYICPLGDVMDFAMPNGLLKKNIDVEINVDFIQIADEYAEKEKIEALLSQLQKTAKKQYNLFCFILRIAKIRTAPIRRLKRNNSCMNPTQLCPFCNP